MKHFLDINTFDQTILREILEGGSDIKRHLKAGNADKPLAGKTLVMIFEKPSTRTRVSFQVGMQQLGGMVVVMNESESQLGQGETIADTARVLSRYADAIMIRTDDHQKLIDMAEYATVPVINGLTDDSHPCQIMADIMTFEEHRGSIAGKTITWCGDGNNVAVSWIHAAVRFGFELRLACPSQLEPPAGVIAWARSEGGNISLSDNVEAAVKNSDLVIADTWVSMGDKDAANRHNLLKPFQVNEALMSKAADDSLFMHCLPAHRGEEATNGVLDGEQSVIWDEAENRLHAQKGILNWCLS